jgi:hypothetical protein
MLAGEKRQVGTAVGVGTADLTADNALRYVRGKGERERERERKILLFSI